MIKNIIKKLFNYTYGFDISELDPNKQLEVYFYHRNGIHPIYSSDGAVGADVVADLNGGKLILHPGDMFKIPTGLFIELPKNREGRLTSRSGLSTYGLLLMNGVGEVDFDYRGELHFPVKNISNESIEINDGDRIGQIIISKIDRVKWVEVPRLDMLSKTKRGGNGFGSTGM